MARDEDNPFLTLRSTGSTAVIDNPFLKLSSAQTTSNPFLTLSQGQEDRFSRFKRAVISPVERVFNIAQRPDSFKNVLAQEAIEDFKRNPQPIIPEAISGIVPGMQSVLPAIRAVRGMMRKPGEVGERLKKTLQGKEIVTGSDVAKDVGIENLPSGTLPRFTPKIQQDKNPFISIKPSFEQAAKKAALEAIMLPVKQVTVPIDLAMAAAEKQGTISGLAFDVATSPWNLTGNLIPNLIKGGARQIAKIPGVVPALKKGAELAEPVVKTLGKAFIHDFRLPEAYANLKNQGLTKLRNGIGEVFESLPERRKEIINAAKRLGKDRSEVERTIVDFVENPKISPADVPDDLQDIVFTLKKTQKGRIAAEHAAGVPTPELGGAFEAEIADKYGRIARVTERRSKTLLRGWSKKTKAIKGEVSSLQIKRQELADLVDNDLAEAFGVIEPAARDALRKDALTNIDGAITRLQGRHNEMTQRFNEALANQNFPAAQRLQKQIAELKLAQANEPDYFIHSMTPEAKKAMAKAKPEIVGIVGREFKVKNSSMLRREFTHSDGSSMTISEVNDLARSGKLRILGNKPIKNFFYEDPVVGDAIRGIRSARSIASADFFSKVKAFAVADGIETTVPELKGLKFPKEIADDLVKIKTKLSNTEEINALFRAFDYTQNIWKAYATSVNPGFHLRNAYSNVFQNYLAGLKDVTKYVLAADIMTPNAVGTFVTKAGKSLDYSHVKEIMLENGVINHGFFGSGELGEVAEQSISHAMGLRRFGPATIGRKFGGAIENNARVALFLDGIDKGMDIQQAAKRVKKYLFDYNELTDFEKGAMRRVFPFYTWARKNVPLQAEQVVTNPQKYARLSQVKTNLERGNELTQEEKKATPEYIKEKFIIALPRKVDGMREVMAINLPIEDLNILKPLYSGKDFGDKLQDSINELVSRTSPPIQAAYQVTTGKSPLTGRPLAKEGALVDAPGWIGRLPGPAKKAFGVTEGRLGSKMDPKVRAAIDSATPPPLKLVPSNKTFGNDNEKTRFEQNQASKMMSYLAGFRIFPIDIRQGLKYYGLDMKRKMQEENTRKRSLNR